MKRYLPIGNEDPIVTLSRMVTEANFKDIPEHVVQYSKWIILDTLGAMIGGSGMDGVPQVVAMVKEQGGSPQSHILLYGGKAPAAQVGMAVGPMARAIDWSTIHLEAMHTAEHTLPSVLAALGLKEKVSGKEFITAFVMGQEVLIRIGNAWKPTRAVAQGRSNGHYIFGAAASVGKLLGLNLDQMVHAQGIVRSMTQPHDMAAFHPITHMVKVHHGFICQDAINACDLALRGITGPRHEVLVGPRGFLGMADWETEPEEILKDLGVHWDQIYLESKTFPGCKSTTTAVFGVWDMMEEHHLSPNDIATLDFFMPKVSCEMLAGPAEEKLNPRDEYECQFSLPYMIATALLDGEILPKSYQATARSRKEIREYMPKVSLELKEGLKPWSTEILLTTTKGEKYQLFSDPDKIRGSLRNQFTQDDYLDKFKKCVPYSVYPLAEEVVDRLLETLLNLERCDDVVRDVVLPLTPGQ